MTKDQEFKLLFENWKAYTNIEESNVSLDAGGKDMDTLSSELFNFIKSNKKETNKQQIIDFIKNTFEIFTIINKDNQKKIDSLLNSKIPDQPFVSDLPDEDIDKLAKDVTNAVFQAYSSEHYTDMSANTKDSLKKKGEKFVPGATNAELADVAKVMAALGIAKISASAAQSAFTKGSILGAVKSAFTGGKTAGDIISAIKNNPAGVAKKLALGGAVTALLSAGAAGVYYLYKGVTGKEQKDLTDAEKKQLEQLQNDPKYKEFLKKAAELEAKKKERKASNIQTKGLDDLSNLGKLKGNTSTIGNIQHNIKGDKKEFAESLLNMLTSMGFTNNNILLGVLGTMYKESKFKAVSENPGYSLKNLKDKTKAVTKKVRARFKEQGFGEPTEEHLRSIAGGGKNGPALFNIAYGYSKYMLDERLDAQQYPVLVNGKINPALYDVGLAGWKYRGRGAIGVTFKANYVQSAKSAGIDFGDLEEKIIELDKKQAGQRGALPVPNDIAIALNAGYLKTNLNAAISKLGVPQTPEQGLALAIKAVGGLGNKLAADNNLGKQYNVAANFIRKSARIVSQSAVAESKTATIKIIKGGNNNA